MAHITENGILEVSTTTGVVPLVLAGAVASYRPFSAVCASGDTCHYSIATVDVVGRPTGEREAGRGTLLLAAGVWTLRRDTVIQSSNGGSLVNFAAGNRYISLTVLAPTTDAIRFDWQTALGLDMSGAVSYFAMNAAPSGWVRCNGAALSRTAYSRLFSKIGTQFGVGDGSTTFNVPELRGEFVRCWDDGRTLDNGRVLGNIQDHALGTHGHGINDPGHVHGVNQIPHAHAVSDGGHTHSAWTDGQGEHNHIGGFQTTGSVDGRQGYGMDRAGGYANDVLIPGNNGSYVTGIAGNHGHNVGVGISAAGIAIFGEYANVSIASGGTGISVAVTGASETRPRNMSLLACIKY